MIKSYIVQLQSRVKNLEQLIGDTQSYQKQSKYCKQKIDEIGAKILSNKQLSKKYQKISNFVEKYSDHLDYTHTADKINIVIDELDSITQTSQTLTKIQKNLPQIDNKQHNNIQKFENLDILSTCSSVKLNQSDKIQITEYNAISLLAYRQQQRKQMNAIMELNYRIVNNLNEKIKIVYRNRSRNQNINKNQ